MARHATILSGGRKCDAVRQIVGAGALLVFLLAAGCVSSDYERVLLGMSRTDCYRALTHGAVWQTELGLCQQDPPDAGSRFHLVVITGLNQRIAGKFEVFAGDVGALPAGAALLRGEFSPSLAGLNEVGPLDAARAVALDLAAYRGVRGIEWSYTRVAAALLRLVACESPASPDVASEGAVADVLRRFEAADVATVEEVDGQYRYELRRSSTP